MIKLIKISKIKDKWIHKEMEDIESESIEILNKYIENDKKNNDIEKEFLEIFGLKNIKTINAFDNTHFSGFYHIGAMICVESGLFKKNSYRRYNFRNLNNIADDFSMMYEMVYRRLKEIIKNDKKIDLFVIDGGKQQMSAVQNAMTDLNYFIPFICIKKGENRKLKNDTFLFKEKEIFFNNDFKSLLFLQSIRDEVHRFASGLLEKKHISTIYNKN